MHDGCTVSGNTVHFNGFHGIVAAGASIVIGNAVRLNDFDGLTLGFDTGYSQNVLTQNGSSPCSPQVNGGISLGHNVCGNDTSCP